MRRYSQNIPHSSYRLPTYVPKHEMANMYFYSKRFITWASKNFDMPILDEFYHAIRKSMVASPRIIANVTNNATSHGRTRTHH